MMASKVQRDDKPAITDGPAPKRSKLGSNIEALFKYPEFKEMMLQMMHLLYASTQHLFNEQAYLSAANKVIANKQLMATVVLIVKASMEPGGRRIDFTCAPALLAIKQKIDAGTDGWSRFLTDTGAVREFMKALKLYDIAHLSASVDKPGQVEAEKSEKESKFEYAPDLHCDACHGDVEGLKKTLASGADKNELDHYGGTALHAACAFGKENCAEILLENGFAVDAVDNQGYTPLHYAVSRGYKLCVESLLKHGAHMLKNASGKTPIDIAKEMGEEGSDILKMLLQEEASPQEEQAC